MIAPHSGSTPVPAVLAIGGLDSSGGAGLSRDVRTLTELGIDALCIATAVTAQTDSEVIAIHHVPSGMISAQIKTALATRQVAAIKIGMLGTAASVQAVSESLLLCDDRIPVILDPVLESTSGGVLLDDEGRDALRRKLLPRVTLLTPNLPEAAALLGPNSEIDVVTQAQRLLALGPAAVLIKGGHGTGDQAIDYLVSRSAAPRRFALPRLNATRRGTGCALAAAISAGLASGTTLEKACYDAKMYVQNSIGGRS